jgi:hypothetical protein
MADPLTDTLNRRAAFAQNFLNTGNLDQRRRFAQDISDAAERNKEREAAEFAELERSNPQLMNAVTGRMAEERLFEQGRQQAGLAERKFERLKERDVSVDRFQERSLKLREQANQRAIDEALFVQEEEEAANEAKLIVEMRESDIRRDKATPPGSPAYKRKMLDLLIKNPDIRKETRDLWLKQIGFEDPDAAIAQAAALMSKDPNITRQSVKTGLGTVTMEKPEAAKPAKVDVGRLDRLKKNLAELNAKKDQSEADRDLIGYYSNEIAAIDEQRKALVPSPDTPGPTPAAPGTTVDLEGARALIKEAGGDVNKARALAKERGLQY